MLEQLIDIFLLGFLAAVSIAILRFRDLFTGVMLFGIYSLISASLFMVLDAADVAFTEAAVGAGISSILMMATLSITGREEKTFVRRFRFLPLFIVTVTGATLLYGIIDLPPFGHAENPVHVHVAPRYLQESAAEIDVPNVVTAVLASYRGFDTLGEVVVIFTAGVGVLALIGRRRRRSATLASRKLTDDTPAQLVKGDLDDE
jgi:multicomponent Na+:H+ antiporter subunit B